MRTAVKSIVGAVTLLVPCALAAQTFKCVDTNGKITYSGKKCSDLGLKDAGEVKDRLNINPALPTGSSGGSSEGRPAARSAPPAAAPKTQPPEAPLPVEEPSNPQRRCFTISTPKGPATRCNDTPSSDAPPD